jgi:hypothetical protein
MLSNLDRITRNKTKRESSWDRSGGNLDFMTIGPGCSAVLADLEGPAVITHIWLAQKCHYRECLLKITWDNSSQASVICPLGDFFCLGNSIVNSFQSLLFSASTRVPHRFDEGAALNCYAPMRFNDRALIEIINESAEEHQQFFHIDYETLEGPFDATRGYFHAEFRRANPFMGWGGQYTNRDVRHFPNKEKCAYENNYVILETRGHGHYIGCNLSVTNLSGDWWGEGDEMIWIDGYKWPPDIHGTGSEDYFNQAWGMNKTAFLRNGSSIWEGDTSDGSRYQGVKVGYGGRLYGGYQTSYVFHIENPVRFDRSIKVTIEAGHANFRSNEMSSVAYWYAAEPSAVVAPPPVKQRMPVLRDNYGNWIADEASRIKSAEVSRNAEFKKAMEEYNNMAERNDWPPLKAD